ncbi:MAG: T9SS type A sorting domain-containing protein [Cytophagaceae bacterium]|nr:T9SS type A sorting domain-containing protein [Cytophagaceae bacterium]
MKKIIFSLLFTVCASVAFSQVFEKRGYAFEFNDTLCQTQNMITADTPYYKVDNISGGALQFHTDGLQLGWYNLRLDFVDSNCYPTPISLSNPSDRSIYIKVNSSVYVPQFFIYVHDYRYVINNGYEASLDIRSLQVGDNEFNIDVSSLAGTVWDSDKQKSLPFPMDSTGITGLYLYFRKSWCDNDGVSTPQADYCNGRDSSVAGTFRIDRIQVGNPALKQQITTAVRSFSESSNLYSITPNPIANNFCVTVPPSSSVETTSITLYSLAGNRVWTGTGTCHEISNVQPGIYLAYIYEGNLLRSVKKVVIL